MNFNKGHLLSFYEEIENKRKEREEYIEQVQKIDKEIQVKLLEYRINSVSRVLSYLHSESFNEDKHLKDYGNIITHCCNKLSGNIDGIELDLKEE